MAPGKLSAGASDGQLMARVRDGDLGAYDGLYARHFSVASNVARKHIDNPCDAEDIVAEAFQSVLQSLVEGKGPERHFRAYLLSAVTRLSHHKNRKENRFVPTSDEASLDRKVIPDDPAVQAFESRAVARAFQSLPERWRSALWYLDVERMKPAAVAPIMGLTPNAVSALGVRAREGLRRQYLQMHVSDPGPEDCADFASRLGSYVRGGLHKSFQARVREHLDGCARCTAVLFELKDVEGTIKSVFLPIMTGIPLATWGVKAGALGVVGQIPAVVSAFGVGMVLGVAGLVDLLAAKPG